MLSDKRVLLWTPADALTLSFVFVARYSCSMNLFGRFGSQGILNVRPRKVLKNMRVSRSAGVYITRTCGKIQAKFTSVFI